MSFLEVLKHVTNYGLSVVLSAIVIYVILKVIKVQFDKIQASTRRKEHDAALNLRGNIDEEVYQVLNNFIEEHHGLR